MQSKSALSQLLRSPQTVFTFKDIALLWRETNTSAAKARIHHYVKRGELYPIRRGIYGKDAQYDRFELGTKIYTPAYISMETVLSRAGVIFQYDASIRVISYLNRVITAEDQNYVFRKIKWTALSNHAGIEIQNGIPIASPERAFLDLLYLNEPVHLDHVESLNWKRCFELVELYRNKNLEKRLKDYHKNYTHA